MNDNEANLFRDEGFSGATLNRPGLDALRERISHGEIDRLLVTAPDRLARNYVHQVLLLEEFETHGCLVEFLERPMSEDPHDQSVLQIRGAVAEYERKLITDRMRRGKQAKYQAGLLLPFSEPPYGYRLDPDHPRDPRGLRLEESEAAWAAEMFAYYEEPGHSLRGLALELERRGVPARRGDRRWNPSTVSKILRNPIYTGVVYAGRHR